MRRPLLSAILQGSDEERADRLFQHVEQPGSTCPFHCAMVRMKLPKHRLTRGSALALVLCCSTSLLVWKAMGDVRETSHSSGHARPTSLAETGHKIDGYALIHKGREIIYDWLSQHAIERTWVSMCISWGIVGLRTLYPLWHRRILWKIYKDFTGEDSISKWKLAKEQAVAKGERTKPREYMFRPDTYSHLVGSWMYWSLGVIVAMIAAAGSLTEVLMMKAWSDPWLLIGKIFGGLFLIGKKVKLMEMLTIEGNKAATSGNTPALSQGAGMTDQKWRGMTKICFACMMGFVVYMAVDLVKYENTADRPRILNIYDYTIISILLVVMVIRSIDYLLPPCGALQHHYVVRKKERPWNRAVDNSVRAQLLDIYEGWFQKLDPSKYFDIVGLYERLDRRSEDRFCWEWCANERKRHIYLPEMGTQGLELLQQSLANTIDWHTKLNILIVKFLQVEAVRQSPLKTTEIKLPFRKQRIQRITLPIGIDLGQWDEQYSEQQETKDGRLVFKVKTTESNQLIVPNFFRFLLDPMPQAEEPRWFRSEFEGAVTYEALVAPFAPTPNTMWKDLVSDDGLLDFFMYGLGQSYLVGRDHESLAQLRSKYGGKIPENTTHIVDYTWIAEYKVRERCARYGFIACFDLSQPWFGKEEGILCIYVSHWDWDKWPDQNKRKGGGGPKPNPWQKRPTPETTVRDRLTWEHAKYVIKASIGTGMTLKEHLTWQHWIVSNSGSLAAREKLERHHQLRRLLHPFLVRSASINYMTTLTLVPEKRYVHRAAGFEYDTNADGEPGLVASFDYCMKTWKFDTFPERVKSRCLGKSLEENLPWAQDGIELWNTLRRFVETWLTIYYPDERSVAEDPEVNEFWDMVNGLPPGPDGTPEKGYGYKLPPLREGKGAFENLVDYVTHLIFGVTADHELYGSVIQYFTTPMGLTTKIWNETYEDNDLDESGQVMQDVQTFLQALIVIAGTGVPMPKLIADWTFLIQVQKEDEHLWKGKVKFNGMQRRMLQDYLKVLWEEAPVGWPGWKSDMMGCNGVKNNVPGYRQEPPIFDSKHLDEPPHKYQDGLLKEQKMKFDALVHPARPDALSLEEHNELLGMMHAAFMEHLTRLNTKIQHHNSKRKHIFADYLPENLECSVSI